MRHFFQIFSELYLEAFILASLVQMQCVCFIVHQVITFCPLRPPVQKEATSSPLPVKDPDLELGGGGVVFSFFCDFFFLTQDKGSPGPLL